MVGTALFKKIALSFQGAIEQPHFDRTAFKVVNKRIFATLHEKTKTVNIKFTPHDQSVFCKFDPQAVYPVPNKFGLQGWTTFDLMHVPEELIAEALRTAYEDVLKPKKKM
jgi:hypothetical protein